MDHKTLSDLIGLIYDTAFDISHWPRLANMLVEELAPCLSDATGSACCDSGQTKVARLSGRPARQLQADSFSACDDPCGRLSNAELVRLLRSHFDRALAMNKHMADMRQETSAMQSLLDRLPLGMLIVDHQSRVIAHNSELERHVSEGKGLVVSNGVLAAHAAVDTVRLRRTILRVANGSQGEGEAIRIMLPDTATAISVLLLPFFSGEAEDEASSERVLVLVATPETPVEVGTETLMSLYQLTRAEAKLVASLVRDRSLNAIAEDFGISKHTIRNQLKSVYEKTGTHRQAELVRQVIAGPAMLAAFCKKDKTTIHFNLSSDGSYRISTKERRRDRKITLPDGRRLSYAEYGATDGRPVILMHASNGSRLERHPDETIIERCGIRLIIPDRPGVGLSDADERITFYRFTQDVASLADHLELDRFNMIGYSLGGAYALACAHRLKERIGRLVLAASVAPFDSLDELEGVYFPCRLLIIFGRYAPVLAKPLARFVGYQLKPESYPQVLWRDLPPVDRALVSDVAVRERIMESARENRRQGAHHVLREILQLSHPWGFALDQIDVPTTIWHGEQDRVVPPRLAHNIAQALPNSDIRFLPEAGHYLLFHCWKEILRAACQ